MPGDRLITGRGVRIVRYIRKVGKGLPYIHFADHDVFEDKWFMLVYKSRRDMGRVTK